MRISVLGTVEISSSLGDCWFSDGGEDGQREQGHRECEGTPAGACDLLYDGEKLTSVKATVLRPYA